MEEGKTAKQLTQEIVSDISYTKEDEKKVEQVIKKAMETQTEEKPKLTMEASGGTSQTTTKPKLTMEASGGTSQTSTKPKLTMEKAASVSQRDVAGAYRGRSNYENIGAVLPVQRKQTKTMETQTESEQKTGGTQTEEPIIEISKVAETEQIRRQEEMPMDFSVGGISGQRLKEGKTTLKQLQDEMPQPIQKPNQLLQWINKVGGYENYVYLRSKFGLTEDIQGSMEYLQEIEKCLVNLYGGDLGVGMANYSNDSRGSNSGHAGIELELKQCIRELNIMKNCMYISKFKAAVGPQYGLVIGLNKVMSLADMLGKAPPMPQSSQEQTQQMAPNKPVVKGQERIEYEQEKAQLVQGLPQQPQRGRRLNVANPEISPDVIQESNLERGTKSQKVAPSRSIHEMVMQGQTPIQQQAMTISRGIKLMKARKQF
jgi:hypothetical protein